MLAKKTKAVVARSFAHKGKDLLFDFSSSDPGIGAQSSSSNRRGQVVLEYVLLLAVALVIGAIAMRNLIGTTDNPAGIRAAWSKLIKQIGQDLPDRD